MALELNEVACCLGFPEGPVAMADGSVLFVQIQKETLSRLGTDGKVVPVAEIPGGPNGVAIGPDGAAYVCNNGGVYTFLEDVPDPYDPSGKKTITVINQDHSNYIGGSIQRVDLDTGAVMTLYDAFEGTRLLAPDDIVFDNAGGFYFTETGIQDAEKLQLGALYYATIDGKTLIKVAQIAMANGVGLSPGGETVYVSDTIFGRLWALDLEIDDSDKANPKPIPGKVKPGPMPGMPGRVIQTLPEYQWLDSLKVEADGRICVGTIFNGGITVFTPDGKTEHIPVADIFTTNLCFGGADMQDVWITASSTGKIYKGRWPRPGLKLEFNG